MNRVSRLAVNNQAAEFLYSECGSNPEGLHFPRTSCRQRPRNAQRCKSPKYTHVGCATWVLRRFQWNSVTLTNLWLSPGEYRRSLPVVPLIADKRYYGETTRGLPTYPQDWLVADGAGQKVGLSCSQAKWKGSPRCGKPANGESPGAVRYP